MPVKIRLQRKGRKKRPFYHIVIADARAPRDGKFIEKIGTYNPMTKPATIDIDRDKAFDWIMKGAQPTDTVRAILRFKGVLFKKHLMRGVKKGALTQEEADKQYQEWIDAKEAKIAARVEATRNEKLAFHAKISGTPPPKEIAAVEEVTEQEEGTVEEEVEAGVEETQVETPTAEAGTETTEPEEAASEEAPKEEAVVAESAEEPAASE